MTTPILRPLSATGQRGTVPARALAFSALALSVPLLTQAAGWRGDGQELLLWLLALIPPFLMAYYRGWSGAATALAVGMVLLAAGEVIRLRQGVELHHWTLLFGAVATYALVSVAAGVLSEALHRQRLVAERRAGEVVWLLDASGVIRYASPSTESVTGLPERAFVGHRLEEMEGVDVGTLPASVGADVPRDVTITTPTHERRILEVSFEAAPDGSGSTVAVGRDVTVQRQLLDRATGAERLQALGRLAAGVAHDFNNVLTVVAVHSELLRTDPDIPDPARRSIEEILQAAEHATDLTRQLLVFSRSQSATAAPVDVGPTVQRAEPLLKGVLRAEIPLELVIEAGVGQVLATPGEIEQILINLATNARDAMAGAGGCVRVSVSDVAIPVGGAPGLPLGIEPGDYVRLRVTDTGQGMDAATRARVFEPFFTTKPVDRGTGLGLSTVHKIVTDRGGFIGLESAPGLGTSFDIFLPRLPGATAPGTAGMDPAHPSPSRSILVVGCSAPDSGEFRRTFEQAGYAIVEASDAQQALEEAGRMDSPFVAAIADLQGADMSAGEFRRRLRRRWPGLRLLLVGDAGEHSAAGEILPRGDSAASILARMEGLLAPSAA